MRDHNPIFSSELIAAHRAVHPILVREQRPLTGSLIALLVSILAGFGAGYLFGRPGVLASLVIAAILGLLTGGTFRQAVRPIEMKWRGLATLLPAAGWIAFHLAWSHPRPETMLARLGLSGTANLLGLAIAATFAWYFSYRMPTQDDIIQRARRLGSAG